MQKYEEQGDLKQKIEDAAWKLFNEKGYEETTVNDIIKEAGTSKGGFYYYFKAKDELLNALYSFFDREYEKFYKTMDKELNSLIQLEQLAQYVAYFIEVNVSAELLAALYQSQLVRKKQDNFLSEDRFYIKLVKYIVEKGQERNEIRKDMTVDELTHHVLLLERGIFTDWCVQNGAFSLGYYGGRRFRMYTEFMKPVE